MHGWLLLFLYTMQTLYAPKSPKLPQFEGNPCQLTGLADKINKSLRILAKECARSQPLELIIIYQNVTLSGKNDSRETS